MAGDGNGQRGSSAPVGDGADGEEHDHRRVIAIDGPAAAGKSTVARALADELGATLFDTGTLYRAVTLAALRAGVDAGDGDSLADLADERHIEVAPPSSADGRLYDVRLDGEDVTWAIREPGVEASVSRVAAHPEVRTALLPVQRRIADDRLVVMVGRDIGTTVVPDAGVKVFLLASVEERARRRHRELVERDPDQAPDFERVLGDLRERDGIDAGRASSPLRAGADATLIDTDDRPADEVVAAITEVVKRRWAALGVADPVLPSVSAPPTVEVSPGGDRAGR